MEEFLRNYGIWIAIGAFLLLMLRSRGRGHAGHGGGGCGGCGMGHETEAGDATDKDTAGKSTGPSCH